MNSARLNGMVVSGLIWLALAGPVVSSDPPALSHEAQRLFAYLQSIYGQKCLVGQNKFAEAEKALAAAGQYPALISVDLSGWSKARWDETYRRNLQEAVSRQTKWWHQQGGIVSFEWHWANPMKTGGDFRDTQPSRAERPNVARMTEPGTAEHTAAMEDLSRHADYLAQLRDARVPVLWRPLHEIDGGWFWWTDLETPENTARLWRMMFDYLGRQRGLTNLIWVYSAALRAGEKGRDVAAVEYRRRFYPGSNYTHLAGIDIYVNDWYGWPDYRTNTYSKAFEIMQQVAPGKMLALCECQGIPNPRLLAAEGPRWLYCLPWYVGDKEQWNPPRWVKEVYPHEIFVTLDRLPKQMKIDRPAPPGSPRIRVR